jgi:hypothetical protein
VGVLHLLWDLNEAVKLTSELIDPCEEAEEHCEQIAYLQLFSH